MDYAILQNDTLPVALQNKPRWVTLVLCTTALLVMTLSAVTVGAFIGYTFCYVENRSGYKKGNIYSTNLEVFPVPPEPKKDSKKTSNSEIFSSILISWLMEIGQSFKEDVTHLTNGRSDFSIEQKNSN